MVRAAPNKEQRTTAWLSFASTVLAAIVVLVLWASLRGEPQPTPPQRGLSDVTLDWVCEKNGTHRFRARGRVEPRVCDICGGTCYIALRYSCPEHGEFDVLTKFTRVVPADGEPASSVRERVHAYRHQGRQWEEYKGHVDCPVQGCRERTSRSRRSWGGKAGPKNRTE
jgi:hypothetical protein